MTELLENSDNTNADTGVSESPANEATISLAAVQALADALQKIESYTPTVWVDNESPDIDAAHLNKAEQAIMRVTTAMNSAVDVIKDLQSQVNTTNNNLSKRISIVGYKDGWVADASSENNRLFVLNFGSDKGQDQMIVFKDRISVTLLRDGVWQEQYKVATLNDLWPQSSGTEITAGTDMQTITTPGHYCCGNNGVAASLKNCPMSDAFTLVVYRAAGGSGDNIYYVAQEYTSYLCNRRVIQTYNKDSKKWTTHEIQFKS